MTTARSRRSTRVLIVDDREFFADSLEGVLEAEGYAVDRLAVPRERGPRDLLVSEALRTRPQVALLDLDLGRAGDGAALIPPLALAGVDVVVLTASTDRARWGECLDLGARTVLTKATPLSDLLSTVRRVAAGATVLSASQRTALLDAWRHSRAERSSGRRRLGKLTEREEEVLGELIRGRAVKEIARESVVSEATVRTQVKAILGKLDVSSQLAAVGLAKRLGWRRPRGLSEAG